MCGRFTLTTPGDALAEAFELQDTPALEPRYNIAPGTPIAAVGQRAPDQPRRLSALHWGLPRPGATGLLINVRLESLATRGRPHAWLARRCLVPADGFYEWQRTPEGARWPHLLRPSGGGLFAFAGLWQARSGASAACALVTTPAQPGLAHIHTRMPALVPRAHWAAWLGGGATEPLDLLALVQPCRADQWTSTRVSSHVNNARHDDPGCLLPA